MRTLKYKIIKTEEQYFEYCNLLETLLEQKKDNKETEDEVELLTYLIEKWDSEHSTIGDADPVEVLKSLMKEKNLKAKDLVSILSVSKGLVSDILNYKKGMSKHIIRSFAGYFKVSHEVFNRPYELKGKKSLQKGIPGRENSF